MDKAGGSLRHTLDKVKLWHFHITSNYMQGLKSAIMAIFQTGQGWPYIGSATLNNPSQDFKNYFLLVVDELLAMQEGSIRLTPSF